jgi:UDP-N-acetylmuramyl pentapeptide phosphotransferase/UDP-N-acetylglucosamine-1-phosphate transferase
MRQIALSLSLAGLAFIMTAIWGGPLCCVFCGTSRSARSSAWKNLIHHRVKMGTPTMGGVMFILPVLLLTGLLNAVALIGVSTGGVGRSILLPMIVMVGLPSLAQWTIGKAFTAGAKEMGCAPVLSSCSRLFWQSPQPMF